MGRCFCYFRVVSVKLQQTSTFEFIYILVTADAVRAAGLHVPFVHMKRETHLTLLRYTHAINPCSEAFHATTRTCKLRWPTEGVPVRPTERCTPRVPWQQATTVWVTRLQLHRRFGTRCEAFAASRNGLMKTRSIARVMFST